MSAHPPVFREGAAQPAGATSSAVPPVLVSRSFERIQLWDWPTRVFHWSLVAAVTVAIVTAQWGGNWMTLHGQAGLTILGLVVFRIAWGVVGSTHSRFLSFFPTPRKILHYVQGRWQGVGHNPLGALSVFALLTLLLVQAGTGLFSNDDIAFTGPLAGLIDTDLSLRLTGIHRLVADGLYILLGVHVAAIVFYVAVKKDNLVKPMVTGYKTVRAGLSHGARRGGWLAFAIAAIAAGSAVYLASGAALPQPEAPPAAASGNGASTSTAAPAAAW